MNKHRVISALHVAAGLTCVLSVLSSPAFADCSASASANAGDTVTVLAILHTIDPNENGEGEPLAVTVSNGGPTTSFGDYEVTHSYTFKALNTAPVTATGTNVGFEGDESCEISISVNGTHRFSQTTKNVLAGITGGFGVVSGGAWVVAESCTLGLIGPGTQLGALLCSGGAGLTAATTAEIAALAGGLLLIDPIDLNFTVIPVPVPALFTPVMAGNGVTQADANAFNALLNIEAQMVGVLRATTTAVNRASGAASVGNTFWEQQQQNAINGFMVQFGGLLAQDANARQTLVSVLTSEHVTTFTITPQQVLAFERQLSSQGWTASQLAFFHQIGDNDAFANALKPLIFTQDINQVAGTIPATFANQALITTLQQGAHDLGMFVGTDTVTQGNWTGIYGTGGYYIPNGNSTSLNHANISFTEFFPYTWASSWPGVNSDPRALQTAPGATTRIASAITNYVGKSLFIHLNIYDDHPHLVALYLLDWDSSARSETITITDASTGQLYDTETFAGFHNGIYALWNLKGNLTIQVRPNSGPSAVVSGIFIN